LRGKGITRSIIVIVVINPRHDEVSIARHLFDVRLFCLNGFSP
jgi:hypothetical protein